MSRKYRMMIYFVVATLHLYRNEIKECKDPEEFRTKNQPILTRVFDEGLTVFNYELSDMQMGKGVVAYMAKGQNVSDTKVYQRDGLQYH